MEPIWDGLEGNKSEAKLWLDIMTVDHIGAVDESSADVERLGMVITLLICRITRLTSDKMLNLLQDRTIYLVSILFTSSYD
jgi:hypothetical protein